MTVLHAEARVLICVSVCVCILRVEIYAVYVQIRAHVRRSFFSDVQLSASVLFSQMYFHLLRTRLRLIKATLCNLPRRVRPPFSFQEGAKNFTHPTVGDAGTAVWPLAALSGHICTMYTICTIYTIYTIYAHICRSEVYPCFNVRTRARDFPSYRPFANSGCLNPNP